MPSAFLPASLTIPRPSNQSLSSCRALAGPSFFRPFALSPFSFAGAGDLASPVIIRMGGGPRTFPGGVSKWQWKRMQAKKAKQLLKARLCRERQLYEMRKRAELKAAISEIERPWEVVERAPVLFSASADEQVKVLADRFQRPCGFDMWSERDGPQIFRSPDDLPSARFFPKGALASVKLYSVVAGEIPNSGGDLDEGDEKIRYNDWIARGAGGIGRGRRVRRALTDSSSAESVMPDPVKLGDGDTGKSRGSYSSDSEFLLAESMQEKDRSDALNRLNQNHSCRGTDKELRIAGSRMDGDEMVGEFDRDNGRVSHLSDSELVLADLKDGHEMSRDFSGRSGRSRDQSSHGLDSKLMVAGSRMEGTRTSSGFDRGSSRRGGRGSRNGSRSSYKSYSVLPVAGSSMEGDGVVSDFDRRRVRGHNRVSHVSNSVIGIDGSRTNDHKMSSSLGRRGGRGNQGSYRSSHRSYSELTVNDSRTEGNMSDDFDRFSNHGRRCTGNFLDQGWRTEKDGIDGGFVGRGGRGSGSGNRGSHESYSADSRVKGDTSAGGLGRRGGYQDSYCSDSELALAGSRKTREMTGNFGRSRSGLGYKNTGRISLRPTTELRLEEGGDESRGPKWMKSFNDNRQRTSP